MGRTLIEGRGQTSIGRGGGGGSMEGVSSSRRPDLESASLARVERPRRRDWRDSKPPDDQPQQRPGAEKPDRMWFAASLDFNSCILSRIHDRRLAQPGLCEIPESDEVDSVEFGTHQGQRRFVPNETGLDKGSHGLRFTRVRLGALNSIIN